MRKNNSGYTLVIVIIMVALIGILGSVILSTTLFNYEMKAMNYNSKNNFYNAETALEEIQAGLQKNISTAFSKGYIEILQQYSVLDENAKQDQFRQFYSESLCEQLKQEMNPAKYKLELLKKYLIKTAYSEETKIGAKLSSTTEALEVDSKGVILKGLTIEYIDEKNYTTKIKTDLVLKYPELTFSTTTSIPKLLQYCLIANTGLEAKESMTSYIQGNVYSGSNGMNFKNGKVTFKSGSMVVTKGALNVAQLADVVTENKVSLWGKDINVQSADLTLKGTTYVANDLTVKDQDQVSSRIKISNEYYGFGNESSASKAESLKEQLVALHKPNDVTENPADYSSAIIINGRNVTMDLSGVRKLWLGGNAYIGSTKAYMGESLTVKSNQLAYLVPGECVGVGTEYSGMNPMPMDYFLGLQNKYGEHNTSQMVDFNKSISKYGNKTLHELGVTSVETYCVQGGQAYFYMLFDTEKQASKFYQEYSAGTNNTEASKKLNDYLKLYVEQIKLSNNSQIKYTLNGNAVSYNSGKSSYIGDTLKTENQDYIEEQEIGWQNIYAAYCTKLVNSYSSLSDEEKMLDVYGNLIDEEAMRLDLDSNRRKYFVNESSKIAAVAVDNQNTGSQPVRISELQDDLGTIALVLATGDVIVDQDYNGLIIAKGTVTMENNIAIVKSQDKVLQALQAVDVENQPIAKYLKNSNDYLSASTGDNNNDMVSSSVALEELIYYQNWTKE